jgi:hypothetical protein
LPYAQEALALPGGLGPYSQADAWHTLGYAQHHIGLHREALVSYQRAVDRYRVLGMRHLEAETWRCMTSTHRAAGNEHLARQTRVAALACLEGLDHPLASEVRINLSDEPVPATLPEQRTSLQLTWPGRTPQPNDAPSRSVHR